MVFSPPLNLSEPNIYNHILNSIIIGPQRMGAASEPSKNKNKRQPQLPDTKAQTPPNNVLEL